MKMSEDDRFWADWFPGEMRKIFITRDIAERLCSNRGDNVGRFSPSTEKAHIDEFADAQRTGNLPGTNNIPASHHGILIGENDALLDGYHRCAAIVQTGVGVLMQVMYEPTIKSVHELRVDFGKPRSAEFVLGIEKTLRKLATTALSVTGGRNHLHNIERLAKGMEEDFGTWAFTETGKCGPGARSSSIRLPLMVHRHNGTASDEYLEKIYKAFKEHDPRALAPYPFSFWQQFTQGRIAKWGGGGRPVASRAYRAFTEKLSAHTRVQIKDDSVSIREFRTAIEKAYGPYLPARSLHEAASTRAFQQRPPRPWTEDDFVDLGRFAEEGLSAVEIARKLDRSVSAIRNKAYERGHSLETRG